MSNFRMPLLAALLALLAACRGEVEEPRSELALAPDTPVVLVIIDTLRADHLGAYGYPLDTSPNLDAFAEQAYVFEAHTTQCNSTFPSITSILTGLYPRTHQNYLPVPLPGGARENTGVVSLAETLQERGYFTAGVISHPTWHEGIDTAVFRGWDGLSMIPKEGTPGERIRRANGAYTNERVFGLLDRYEEEGGERPLFLWAHYFDPHTDERTIYQPPKEYWTRYLKPHLDEVGLPEMEPVFRELSPVERDDYLAEEVTGVKQRLLALANGRSLYDAEIRYCDFEVQRLFTRLEEMGILEEALVVVCADHGENMEDIDAGHGWIAFTHKRLWSGVSRTPLFIKLPGQTEGARIDALSQNIDITPTIAALLGIEGAAEYDGASLLPLMEREVERLHERVYIESSDNVEKAVQTEELKYIEPGKGADPLLYRWREDVQETRDLSEEAPQRLIDELSGYLREYRPPPVMRMRLVPDVEPYAVAVELSTHHARIHQVLATPPAKIGAEGKHVSWNGAVGENPVELIFLPEDLETLSRWSIGATGERSVWDRIRLGRTPLRESLAFPEYSASDEDAGDRPVLTIVRDRERQELSLSFAGPGRLETELRYARPAYDKQLLEVAREGFDPLEMGVGMIFQYAAKGPGSLRLRHHPRDPDVLLSTRVDGRWPDLRDVSVDGKLPAADRARFVFSYPTDKRLSSTLFSTPDDADLEPGSIVIWVESGSTEVEIDTRGMSPEMIEELRKLGYVGRER